MDPTKIRNELQEGEQPNIGVTHTIRCVGDDNAVVWLYDAVGGEGLLTGDVAATPVLLTAASPAWSAGSGPTVLEVDAIPGGLAIGDPLFIWDITNYRYRQFQVADFDAVGLTITTTAQTGLDIAFATNDIVSFTPPFDDVYRIDVSGKINAATNGRFAYGFLDETPLAFASINDLLTAASLNWSKLANIASGANSTFDEPPILLPRMKPSRYFCVVVGSPVAGGEAVTAYISRRRWNSIAGALDVNGATDIS